MRRRPSRRETTSHDDYQTRRRRDHVRIDPGQETHDSSGLHVRGRVFTDRVESADVCLDGTNRVTLDLDLNLADGSGTLGGTLSSIS